MKKLSIIVLGLVLALAVSFEAMAQRKTAFISHQEIIKTVSQSRGKVVVVNFWASWCGPCRVEVPDFIALRSRLPAARVVMLGVSIDQDQTAYETFVAKAGFNYPVYLAGPDVPQAFMLRAIPRTIVYGPQGEQIVSREGFVSAEELEHIINKVLGS